MKPYQQLSIWECGEALVPIPDTFAFEQPHPYLSAGAPYEGKSPFWTRVGVLKRLQQSQNHLSLLKPGWRIKIFDAYRPVAVQQYMVEYTFKAQAQAQGWVPEALDDAQCQAIYTQVYTFWAVPSLDPSTPPPHSTGAALDVTLVDAAGQTIDMGSPIDEMSPRSFPDHFQDNPKPQAQQAHIHRKLLDQVMSESGFVRHTHEWWHFSYGDQFWAWQLCQAYSVARAAFYGRV